MRKILYSLFAILFCTLAYGQQQNTFSDLKFIDKRIINIGDVKRDSVVNANIRFYNSGNLPLVITKVNKSCTCTNVRFKEDKKIYKPGEKGTINISADTKGMSGDYLIAVVVHTNTEQREYAIRLSFNVGSE